MKQNQQRNQRTRRRQLLSLILLIIAGSNRSTSAFTAANARVQGLSTIFSLRPTTATSSVSVDDDESDDTTVNITWCPSSIHINQIYKQYPATLWRKLTSSVPRREFALKNVTLHIENDPTRMQNNEMIIPQSIVLLVGASSSGKSTILKMVSGEEEPDRGSVDITSSSSTDCAAHTAIPILLDDRDPFSRTNNIKTVGDLLTDCITSLLKGDDEPTISSRTTMQLLLEQLADILNVHLDQSLQNISPSEYYRIRLARACLESSLSNVSSSCDETEIQLHRLPGPIVLLDEWMDIETRQVIQNVMNPCWSRIVDELGGIVICVTHKPNLFSTAPSGQQHNRDNDPSIRQIAMSGGKVLSIDYYK